MSGPRPRPDPGTGTGPAQTRTSFRFSTDGRYAACVAHAGDAWHAEAWRLPADDSPQRLGTPIPLGPRAQVQPRTDGSVWVCQPLPAAAPGSAAEPQPANGVHDHEIALADTAGSDTRAGITGLGLRLVATYCGDRVVAVSTAAARADSMRSTIWMVGDTATPVLTVPGLLGGGVKLTNRIALLWARDGRLSTVLVDLIDGSLTCVWPNASGRRLLLAGGGNDGTASSNGNGNGDAVYVVAEGDRLGWCREDRKEPHWPDALADGRRLVPMAVAPDGEQIAFRLDSGARSDLMLYSLRTESAEVIPLSGTLGATAAWTAEGLFAPLAEPGSVAVVREVGDARDGSDDHDDRDSRDSRDGRSRRGRHAAASPAPPAVVEFPGPAGLVQAVCYGDLDTAKSVVVALHGGPDTAWTEQPDPLLAALSSGANGRGTAVVAVNPRGSRGRSPGRFGVDDVEDVRAVTRALLDRGLRLGLLGSSYGAYVALRTLCAQPEAFERVALTAPFWSMALYDEAGARVRALLDRIAPLEAVRVSALRPVQAKVLIVGGALDEVVPPSHVDGLHTAFRQAGLEVRRIELPNTGHHLHGPDFRQAIESWFTRR